MPTSWGQASHVACTLSSSPPAAHLAVAHSWVAPRVSAQDAAQHGAPSLVQCRVARERAGLQAGLYARKLLCNDKW